MDIKHVSQKLADIHVAHDYEKSKYVYKKLNDLKSIYGIANFFLLIEFLNSTQILKNLDDIET